MMISTFSLTIISTENGKTDKKTSTGQIPEAKKKQYWPVSAAGKTCTGQGARGAPRKGNQSARVTRRRHRRSWIPVQWVDLAEVLVRGGAGEEERRCRRGAGEERA